MGSNSFNNLIIGLEEIKHLQAANPTPPGEFPSRPLVVRAINRSSIVLLCSHLERYIHNINEEAIEKINACSISGDKIPIIIRLQHSRIAIDEIAKMKWEKRSDKLKEFSTSQTWLWTTYDKQNLDPKNLLNWMKSPNPKSIQRFYKMWGIDDIFDTITRTNRTRSNLWLKIQELVDKRHNIAHGNSNTEATYKDIKTYINVVETLCKRSDKVFSNCLKKTFGLSNPW